MSHSSRRVVRSRPVVAALYTLALQACGERRRDYGPVSELTSSSASPNQSAPNELITPPTESEVNASSGSAPGVVTPPEVACPPNARYCDGRCVAATDPTACGPDCIACPVPEGGSATCDGSECHVTCNPGLQVCGETCIANDATCNATCPPNQHACNGQCTPVDNPEACGDDCAVCPMPDRAERALCAAGECSFQCQLGNHACGGECKADDDPSACGIDCIACVAGENQMASCVDGACTVTCAEGYHLCEESCLSNTDPAHCGGSCHPCPVPTGGSVSCQSGQCAPECPPGLQLCLGACIAIDAACDGACPSGEHDCGGICRSNTSPASCGNGCEPCPLPEGAVSATCMDGACDFICGPGTTKCGDECLADTGPAECGAQCKQLPGPRLAVIPEGDLLVGADDLEFATVRVESHFETFCIDQTEVTVADYGKCVSAGSCQTPRSLSGCNFGVSGFENHPVTCIDWSRADEYCRWAGKRLPSEWEWEFAARGPSGRAFPWGEAAPDSRYLNWNYEATGGATTSVGSYPAGRTPDTDVFDLAGNVWEWTASVWCDAKAPGAACQPGVYTARGGSYGSTNDMHVRAAWRDPDSAGDHRFGFRCAYGTVNP